MSFSSLAKQRIPHHNGKHMRWRSIAANRDLNLFLILFATVVLKTSAGDLELELWTKEAPKACRNFIQLCMEGYYDNTIFHRVVKGFIVQGGDPTGSGEGGESVYGQTFKDEFHTRLRFCRRGLLAMANAGKDDNGSQFFFTLGPTPELQNKHTIFGKVTGETIYNMLKLEDTLVDEHDRPLYPQKILKTEVITNPFPDIEPRSSGQTPVEDKSKSEKAAKKTGVKNFKLLSFGEEAEEDEEETTVLIKQFSGKSKSAHDNLADPKLSSAVEPLELQTRGIEDSDSENESKEESREMKERIKNKLSSKKRKLDEGAPLVSEATKPPEEEIEEEYYLGKDRIEERKKQAETIRKEIRELKREVRDENRAKTKSTEDPAQVEKQEVTKSEYMKDYIETRVKYDEAKTKVPKKGKSREDLTLSLLKKFRGKLASAKEEAATSGTNEDANETRTKEAGNSSIEENDDGNDRTWFAHALKCEDEGTVLAKDASTKDDDWFEITDPRNPLNKRRRGETKSNRGRHK